MFQKKIVVTIKKLRESKGISRKTIAEKLNIGVSGYSKIERGEIIAFELNNSVLSRISTNKKTLNKPKEVKES